MVLSASPVASQHAQPLPPTHTPSPPASQLQHHPAHRQLTCQHTCSSQHTMAAMMQKSSTAMGSSSTRRASAARCNKMALTPMRATSQRRAPLRVAAAAHTESQSTLGKFADSIGMGPVSEGVFGFTPFAEMWVSRLAMMGFVISIVEEATGHGGTLQQLGFETPSPGLLTALCALVGTATLVGTGHTAYRLLSKKMTPGDIGRYKNFLGLNNADDFMAAAAAMKAKGDFTSLRTDAETIAATRTAGLPADKVLSVDTLAQADAAASAMKAADGSVLTLSKADEAAQVAAAAAEAKAGAPAPAGPTVSLSQRSDIVELDMFSANAEMRYARNVEITNGRWAQLGFLAAILVEAATGKGIIMQLIMWLKLVGLLGAESGF